jgi:hypothetical protein
MNFNELFKYCQDLNNSSSEKCLVCHIPVENNDKHIKLKCTHIFHPECIGYKQGSIKCLYCEKTSIPEKKNWLTNVFLKPNEISCKIVLKSGPKKGKFCNRINCLYHKLSTTVAVQVINPITSKSIKHTKLSKQIKQKDLIKTNKTVTQKCTHIIKSGIKTGQMCNRDNPCKYHNKDKDNKANKDNKDTYNKYKSGFEIKITSKCQHIIKSGFDKGTKCGRNLPCKYHKNEVINKITNKVPSIEFDNINDEEEILIEV